MPSRVYSATAASTARGSGGDASPSGTAGAFGAPSSARAAAGASLGMAGGASGLDEMVERSRRFGAVQRLAATPASVCTSSPLCDHSRKQLSCRTGRKYCPAALTMRAHDSRCSSLQWAAGGLHVHDTRSLAHSVPPAAPSGRCSSRHGPCHPPNPPVRVSQMMGRPAAAARQRDRAAAKASGPAGGGRARKAGGGGGAEIELAVRIRPGAPNPAVGVAEGE